MGILTKKAHGPSSTDSRPVMKYDALVMNEGIDIQRGVSDLTLNPWTKLNALWLFRNTKTQYLPQKEKWYGVQH